MTTNPNSLENLPQHIAVIMDGNGRWAQAKGLSRTEGHHAGAEAVRNIVTECRRLGIQYLTLYVFSSENWQRPKLEVQELFDLLLEFLNSESRLMEEKGIALKVLGDIRSVPLAARTALRNVCQRTSKGADMTLALAVNYGGRAEIVHAVRRLLHTGTDPDSVTEDSLAAHLFTKDMPDPDLLIRTGSEQRLSNFLLYQCAYTELYFTPTPWPSFGTEHLRAALNDYATRSRRFGKTQEQTHGR